MRFKKRIQKNNWKRRADKIIFRHIFMKIYKKHTKLAVAFLLALATWPQQGFAADYAMTGTQVQGECWSGQIPTTMDMANAFSSLDTSLSEAIEKAKNDIVKALEVQTDVMANLFKKLAEAQAEIQKNSDATKADYESKRRLLLGRSPLDCEGKDAASAGASGKKATEKLREKMNENYAENADGTAKNEEEARESTRKVALGEELKDVAPRGDMLIPSDGLLKEETIRQAQAMARLITDPSPSPKVDAEGTVAGDEARTQQKIKQSRLALAVDTLNAIIAWNSPNTEASLVRVFAEKAGLDPGEIPTVNGHTSMSVFLETLGSKARTLNPNWHTMIADLNQNEGLLKELIRIEALKLFVETQNHQWLQRIGGLLAIQAAVSVEGENGRILVNAYTPGKSPVTGSGGN